MIWPTRTFPISRSRISPLYAALIAIAAEIQKWAHGRSSKKPKTCSVRSSNAPSKKRTRSTQTNVSWHGCSGSPPTSSFKRNKNAQRDNVENPSYTIYSNNTPDNRPRTDWNPRQHVTLKRSLHHSNITKLYSPVSHQKNDNSYIGPPSNK